MQARVSIFDRWQFSSAVLAPVILALGITAAGVLAFVFWSTASIDERALNRQTEMIEQAMHGRKSALLQQLARSATHDDVVINSKVDFDFEWLDTNIGHWMHEYLGHDRNLVVGADNHVLYAMQDGISRDVARFGEIDPPVQAVIDRVLAAAAPSRPGQQSTPVMSADFALISGIPAVIGVTTVVSNTGAIPHQPGTEPLLIAIDFLSGALAHRLGREFLIEGASFKTNRTSDASRAVYPIFNEAGRLVTFFEWERDMPGLMMLRQTGPVLLGAVVIAAVLVYLLLRQLHRSSAALEAGRQQAEHQAAHDRLTGLPNRMNFDTSLAQFLSQGTGPSTNLALLMLDLDRFKQVNDTLGHQAGDELICAVGQRIRLIVGGDPLIARLGGDEFVVMITDREQIEDATAIAGRLIEALGQPFDLKPFKAHVGVSIGIVSSGGCMVEPRELMRKADIALYEAKSTGRNRFVVYEEHMDEFVQLQHLIEGELREALTRDDQLSVVFQPLVDQVSRKVIGAEALARWNHPKFGPISPARFIPVAENTGLIEALGDFVLRRACALGAMVPGRTIAVNISPTQLRNPRFADRVFAVLNRSGMRPQDLELEITESILLDDEHVSAESLSTFRHAGIHIALDDFGTGYSSLSYLKRYPVDRIKIDRSFVMQLAEGHVSVPITQAIVTLAHAMDLAVTAEGVETEQQAAILGQLGCNMLQGFLFSGGVPAIEIIAMLEAKPDTAVNGPIRAA